MLRRKYTHSWLDADNPYSAIAKYSDRDCFHDFFTEEGSLELGEFLLADMAMTKPREYAGNDIGWKEQLFSRMVSEVIRENTERRLDENCADEQAKKCVGARTGGAPGDCPLACDGSHSLADAFVAYGCFRELGRVGDVRTGCMLLNGIDTTMAVVELCATGKIKYVIDYNFDLIIEDALRQVINAGDVASPIKEIHIWTYGATCEAKDLVKSNNGAKCPVVFHRGVRAGRLSDDWQALRLWGLRAEKSVCLTRRGRPCTRADSSSRAPI